jgi:succinate-acetate transporter protein
MNESKFPGAITVGYMALFVSLFFTAIIFGGWYEVVIQDWVTIVLVHCLLLVVIGLFALPNADKLDSTLFIFLGTFWTGFMLRFLWFPNLASNTNTFILDGWICLLVTIVLFILWLASLKGNLFRKLFFLGLWLAFLAGSIANFFNVAFLMQVLAYLFLITAILAGIYGASTIIDFKKTK